MDNIILANKIVVESKNKTVLDIVDELIVHEDLEVDIYNKIELLLLRDKI